MMQRLQQQQAAAEDNKPQGPSSADAWGGAGSHANSSSIGYWCGGVRQMYAVLLAAPRRRVPTNHTHVDRLQLTVYLRISIDKNIVRISLRKNANNEEPHTKDRSKIRIIFRLNMRLHPLTDCFERKDKSKVTCGNTNGTTIKIQGGRTTQRQ